MNIITVIIHFLFDPAEIILICQFAAQEAVLKTFVLHNILVERGILFFSIFSKYEIQRFCVTLLKSVLLKSESDVTYGQVW